METPALGSRTANPQRSVPVRGVLEAQTTNHGTAHNAP